MDYFNEIFKFTEGYDLPQAVKSAATRMLGVQCWQHQCFTSDVPGWPDRVANLVVRESPSMRVAGLSPVILCSSGFFSRLNSRVWPGVRVEKTQGAFGILTLDCGGQPVAFETSNMLGDESYDWALVCWR